MLRAHVWAALLLVAVSCTPEIPEGRAACTSDDECPQSWVCRREDHGGRCWRTPGSDGGALDAGSLDARVLDARLLDDAFVDAGHDVGTPPHDGPCALLADCDDAIACTQDACNAATGVCSHTSPDADHDTYRALCVDATGTMIGDDCDDTRADVHPGAPEICDGGIDDDCDGQDESTDTDLACEWHACADATTCDVPVSSRLGDGHTCALTVAGRLWCWGRNDHGQLGFATPGGAPVTSPRLTTVSAHALQIAAGAVHTCALDARGVVCWGSNGDGQIGDGTMTGDRTAFVIPGTTSVTDIATGDRHSCSYDGAALRCWGANEHGQLGVGDLVNRLSPTMVGASAIMRPLVAGGRHNCYRTADGSAIYCWGANISGQVGNGAMSMTTTTPTQVMFTTADATQLGLGDAHTCLWRAGGHHYMCWGSNTSGQLGTTSASDADVPTLVSGLNPGSSASSLFITAGDSHTCAVDENHQVWCWGANASGQLGTGDTTAHTQPVRNALTPAVQELRAGALHTCAIASGDLWCWGENSDGQIGNGTMVDVSTPYRVTP